MDEVAELLTTINRDTDESFGMLRSVLGDFALDPFRTSDGSTGSLMASMFKNSACSSSRPHAFGWPTTCLRVSRRRCTGGCARQSGLWVIASLLGIAGSPDQKHRASTLAKAAACQRASYDMAAAMQAGNQATPRIFRQVGSLAPLRAVKSSCSSRRGPTTGLGGMFGFRIADVNYTGIRTRAMEAHAGTLNTTYAAAQAMIAGRLAKQYPAQFSAGGISNAGAISDQLVARMKDGSWAALGIWRCRKGDEMPSTTNDLLAGLEAAVGVSAAARSQGALATSTGRFIPGSVDHGWGAQREPWARAKLAPAIR
ncbi:unnamed protein product [Hyaloperonospora brassicae]|uniref:Uncharacterized protein n=1 Tax=Hyaloperonospora brassicae TaxID=162125 RepID=A0AAV0TP46_HYABA|nr:unnamed protein product [Hyaloperonospora brassicae]